MRESWTDDRLDDLNGKVDALRLEMKTEFAAVRGEMNERFAKVDERFDRLDDKLDKRFDKVDERLEKSEARSDERFESMMDRLYSMQRLMVQFYAGLFAALITALAGLIATQL